MSIPVYKPTLKRRDMDAVLTCMVSDEIGPGSLAEQFSKELSRYLNKKLGLALRSPTEALGLALRSLDLPQGASVAVSALSPLYYLDALENLGLQPLFIDVDESSACISPEGVRRTVEQNPAAWIIHSPFGIRPDTEILREQGTPLIEDLTSVVAAPEEDEQGAAAFTMIRTEYMDPITTGGGAVILPGSMKYRRLLKPLEDELPTETRMPDINAALGLAQMQNIESMHQQRSEIYEVLSQALMKSKHHGFSPDSEKSVVPTAFPVVIDTGMNEVRQYALKNGVQTENAFASTPYARLQSEEIDCPVAASLALRTILFPLYPSMGRKNTELLVRILSTLP
ncbi:DegT/DnrJ/EryC1/StrS family aminotransferase [Marispirochaeta aestuarii]|uniref:DegT/DnrJ/EryC1/StrS family aminotransferase n=1 Tax=Marispirochaeta aestuarii TaxID=1963862 RepID=UPI0029C9A243|nr:DegT/DnrJ/EryC1/StrS family aminotransferase [Marispirochaeta aestuarii]